MKRIVAIIDIDTTIANNTVRAAMLQKHCVSCGDAKPVGHRSVCPTCLTETDEKISQESWDTFLRADLMALDTPVVKGVAAIKRMRKHDMEFHFITGRNETLRDVTEEWLRKYVDWDSSRERLVMRPLAKANVPSSKYKESALQGLIESEGLQDASFIFFEDDPWVFRMYSKYGICVKCPEGWEHFCPDVAKSHERVWNV